MVHDQLRFTLLRCMHNNSLPFFTTGHEGKSKYVFLICILYDLYPSFYVFKWP